MDLMEEFKNYLPEWCKKNKKPIPSATSTNKVWAAAWESFMREKILTNIEERKQQLLNIKLLTKKELAKAKQKVEQLSNEIDNNNIKQSSWQRVQQYLK